MLHHLFSRGLSVYPRIYMQFAALVALLIAAEFSLATLSMMLTQRAVHRVAQRLRRRDAARDAARTTRAADALDGNCCA